MTVATPPPPSAEWAYFLDVDGTLIELALTPDGVRIDGEMLDLIARVHRRCDGALALVSGRALADLDARLGLMHVPMSGQHGLEWRNADGVTQRHSGSTNIGAIEAHLATLRRRYGQLIVEDKGMSIALHYRMAPRLGGYLHRWVRNLVAAAGKDLQVQPGKRVIEIKPKGSDKGSAIRTFMTAPPFAGRKPVFIGDDLTDEHGFEVVNQMEGISIKVGYGSTHARYRLQNVAAVLDWLESMMDTTPNRAQ